MPEVSDEFIEQYEELYRIVHGTNGPGVSVSPGGIVVSRSRKRWERPNHSSPSLRSPYIFILGIATAVDLGFAPESNGPAQYIAALNRSDGIVGCLAVDNNQVHSRARPLKYTEVDGCTFYGASGLGGSLIQKQSIFISEVATEVPVVRFNAPEPVRHRVKNGKYQGSCIEPESDTLVGYGIDPQDDDYWFDIINVSSKCGGV